MGNVGECPTIPASPPEGDQLSSLKNELNAEVIEHVINRIIRLPS